MSKEIELTPATRWRWMWSKIEPNLQDKLRKPQYNALTNVNDRLNFEHDDKYRLDIGGRPKIICMGTGAGKSISILINSIFLCAHLEEERTRSGLTKPIRFLVVCPNVNIRQNNFEAIEEAVNYGIIPKEVMNELTITKAKLSEPSIVEGCDGTISTYQNLGKVGKNRLMEKIVNTVKNKNTAESCMSSEFFDVVSVDEAHHYNENNNNVDTTHIEILREFNSSYKLLYTATPYQALAKKNEDGSFFLPPIMEDFDFDNDVIYEYNFRHAYEDGYVKFPEIIKCPSKDQSITIKNNNKPEVINLTSKEMIERFKEMHGNKYLSALGNSYEVWGWLLGATINTLKETRKIPQHNCALIMFSQNKYADKALELYQEMFEKEGLRVAIIHGGIPEKERELRIREMKNDKYDAIFSCQMFNEGFNYPNINIVTYCRNMSSILLFSQTFGRAVRIRKDKIGNPINAKKAEGDVIDVAYVIAHELSTISETLWDMFNSLEWDDIRSGESIKQGGTGDCKHIWESYDEMYDICIRCDLKKKKSAFIEITSDNLDQIALIGGIGDKSLHIKNKAMKDLNKLNQLMKETNQEPLELNEQLIDGWFDYKSGEITNEYTEKIYKIVDKETLTREIEITETKKSVDPEDTIRNNVTQLQGKLWEHIKNFRRVEKLPYDSIIMKREVFKIFKSIYGFKLKTAIKGSAKRKERHFNFCKNDLPHLSGELSDYNKFGKAFGGRLKTRLQAMGEGALTPTQEHLKSAEEYFEDGE